jgi:uncharacterized protein
MDQFKLKMGQGKVVTGEYFWGREREKELFVQRVDEGVQQLLAAQRRMGKTSLMAEVADLLAGRYICLFVDLQKCSSAADAIVELSLRVQPHANLWQKASVVFGNVLSKIGNGVEGIQMGDLGVTLRAGLTAGNWTTKGDHLLDILAGHDKPVLILLDEVPILVNRLLRGEDGRMTADGRKRADEFMSWLRSNSIRHQGSIRFVISGSVGLPPILHQARLSATINNLLPFELPPWDDDTTKGCIRALAAEYCVELADEVPEDMIARLGCCIPHHVQMFFTHIHERCVKQGAMKCDLADVEEVYKKCMLGIHAHGELVHYEERLAQVFDKESFALALDMLTQAAVTGRLTVADIEAFRKEHPLEGDRVAEKDILYILEHDGYLRQQSQGYVFVSKLLKDWWNRRHGQSFVPVLERK